MLAVGIVRVRGLLGARKIDEFLILFEIRLYVPLPLVGER
jgi:hypothetical protein